MDSDNDRVRPSGSGEIEDLLAEARAGDRRAIDALLERLYGELRVVATRVMQSERAGHTLQPTALVHEAYLRLVGFEGMEWAGRPQFFSLAARTMRRILVDYARHRGNQKGGGGATRVSLDDLAEFSATAPTADILDVNAALDRLEARDDRQARLLELRFFTGLTISEAAAVLAISETTAKADYRYAIAWLRRELAA